MTADRAFFVIAGLLVLLSLALGYFVSPYWFLLAAFIGLGVLQSVFTGFCPAKNLLGMVCPIKPHGASDR